ncbi:DUF6207 family protein [Streptomyces sp. HO565]|uniref:DUF6207 family protein n=1 Tax=Streptomyces sp. HO565 TaxID=2857489 RepID=UPI0034DC318E
MLRQDAWQTDELFLLLRRERGEEFLLGGGDEPVEVFQAAPAARWATTSVERTTRGAGQAGVRLRCYLDLRQPLNPPAPAAVPGRDPGPAWGRP